MCRMITLNIDGCDVSVAELKQDYIQNVVDAAKKCEYIDRVILFGSATTENCTVESDIDLAVFGNRAKARCLASAKYKAFTKQIYAFHDFDQSYDILYFQSGAKTNAFIMNEIENGNVIYER